MVQVVWSRRALADLDSIRAYIGQFSPLAAQRMAARLRSAGESLQAQPNRGRLAGRGFRELTIVPPYIVRYRVTDAGVVIAHIRHGAQRPA
ncbi:MAG: type II toxin-antitoxin system RelE/ParE family toxin [Caulobacteraceae bacterium]